MPGPHLLVIALYAACAAASLTPTASQGHESGTQQPGLQSVQFYRGDDQPPPNRFRPDDDDRRYDDRRYDDRRPDDRDRRYDDRYPRDDRGRDDRGRDDRRRDEERSGRRDNPQASQQLLAQQVRDAQTRHNQGVVALQQQFNQRQISRPQMDAGIRQLEVQMNAEIARAQESQRR